MSPTPPPAPRPRTRLDRFTCAVRRFLRRHSWWYLAPLLIAAYPAGWALLLAWQVRGVPTGDQLTQAITAAAAKTVDPLLFFCKLGIGAALFAAINLLGFGALRVTPVLVDWAYGRYAKSTNYQAAGLTAPVPGFKRTFLSESGTVRLWVYIAVWALELLVAWQSMETAFKIQ